MVCHVAWNGCATRQETCQGSSEHRGTCEAQWFLHFTAKCEAKKPNKMDPQPS